MYVGHHAYEKAMRAAAGFAPMEDMLLELDTEEDDLQICHDGLRPLRLLESEQKQTKANALRKKLLWRDSFFWFCFSYLAAY